MSTYATAVPALLGRFYAAEERYIASGGESFEELAPMVHENFVLHQAPSLPFGGTWRGRDGFEDFLVAFTEAWESLDVVDPHVYELGAGRALTVDRGPAVLLGHGAHQRGPRASARREPFAAWLRIGTLMPA